MYVGMPEILCNLYRILQGGVASGFHHVVEDTSPKMYIVKGCTI